MTRALGRQRCAALYRDPQFCLALLAGVGWWLGLWLVGSVQPMPSERIVSWHFLSLVLWQPAVEEVLFRGMVQGQLHQYAWGQRVWHGVTTANGITSLLFMLGHWFAHPPLWATAVLLPALLFGYFRDRYRSVYPSMMLHIVYNAGYFLLTGMPQ